MVYCFLFVFGHIPLMLCPVGHGVTGQPVDAAQFKLVVLYLRLIMVSKHGQSSSTTTASMSTMENDPGSGASAVDVTIEAPNEPLCTEQHVLNCQFSQWYPIFKHCTPRSVIIELGEEVVQYLQEDGVLLPQGFEISCGKEMPFGEEVDDWGNGEEQDEENNERPVFPGLHDRLSEAIASLGGKVFPKLNWSSPQDAAWVNGGTLKCSLPGDVMCLLKSSTFVSHDLNHAFDACCDAAITRPQTFTLVLRKWCTLYPSMLFRCFVRQGRLVGVCQRDCTSYYEFLDAEAERLSLLLRDFFEHEVCKKFPDPDCVADVYVDKKSRVWLLDINPFSSVTDSLLFDWAEDVLCAPLPASTAPTDGEILPPDVSVRLYFDPSSSAVHTVAPVPATAAAEVAKGITGYTLAAGGGTDFEFRCVPSDFHILPDPMGRYRGPADVAMGTLASGIDGNEGLDSLIDACRRAADEI